MSKVRKPRIILFDLETIADLPEVLKVYSGLSAYPGLTLKATHTTILCAGWKVLGEKKVNCLKVWDKKGWKTNVNDDKDLVIALRKVLVSADAIVTHNGIKFDWKFLQTRLMKHGLHPLPQIPHIDTCRLSKSNLLAYNNRLDTLGEHIAGDRKMKHEGWDLWVKSHSGNMRALKKMEKYCKQDVILLEKLFLKMRPFIKNMPNHGLWMAEEMHKICPNCGSVRTIKYGKIMSKSGIKKRYRCNDCGSISYSKIEEKIKTKLSL